MWGQNKKLEVFQMVRYFLELTTHFYAVTYSMLTVLCVQATHAFVAIYV